MHFHFLKFTTHKDGNLPRIPEKKHMNMVLFFTQRVDRNITTLFCVYSFMLFVHYVVSADWADIKCILNTRWLLNVGLK